MYGYRPLQMSGSSHWGSHGLHWLDSILPGRWCSSPSWRFVERLESYQLPGLSASWQVPQPWLSPHLQGNLVITCDIFWRIRCLRIHRWCYSSKDVKTVESKFKRSLRFFEINRPLFFFSLDVQDKRVGPEAEKLFAEAKEMLVQNWDLSDGSLSPTGWHGATKRQWN